MSAATSTRAKLLVAALAATLGCAAVLWWRARRPAAESIRIVEPRPALIELLERRSRAGPMPEGPAGGRETRLEPVDEPTVGLMWSLDPARRRYDPHCFYRHRGGLRLPGVTSLPPADAYEVRTSSDGYREDFERLPTRVDRLVLVTGDSHVDGVCANERSFANLVERRLASRRPGLAIEVLNAGVSGYSFYHYLGVLERDVELAPRAFVVAWYGGNDFGDLIAPWHYFHCTLPPRHGPGYWDAVRTLTKGRSAVLGNLLSQAAYFRQHPEQAEIALRAATEVCREIRRICAQRGIDLFFVHIPFGALGDERFADVLREGAELLGLTGADHERCRALSRRLAAELRGMGCTVLDLEAELAGEPARYYWIDLHVNTAAHARIAELLEPVLAPSIDRTR